MKLSVLIALAISLLVTSACVIVPLGGGRGYYGDHGDGDYGRRVWRE